MNILEWLFPIHRAAELNTDQARRDDIADACDRLTGDELEVLARIADRLVMGRKQYGELCLKTDRRDFDSELLAELLDACAYAAMRLITKGER